MHNSSFHVSESKGYNVDTVKFLIDHGANVNVKTAQGYSALIYASRDGFLDTVKYLIEKEAEVNSTTSFGYTALMVSFKFIYNKTSYGYNNAKRTNFLFKKQKRLNQI